MNKISISKLDEIINANSKESVDVEWSGVQLNIKTLIPLNEVREAVDDVVAMCFDDVEYTPDRMDYAIKKNIVQRYTNVKLPENEDHAYDIIYKSGILNVISENVNRAQLNEFIESAKSKVEYIKETNTSEMIKRINTMALQLEEVMNNATKLFSQISPDDIKNVMAAIANTNISEEKLVEAYLKNK